jgi:hypothetical protein
VLNVGIIKTDLKLLFIRSNNFPLKFVISIYIYNFHIFSPTRIAKLGKFETKKTCWLVGGMGAI